MSTPAEQPPPDQEFALRHELFILDANLAIPLNQMNMEPITRALIDHLMIALRMRELGPLELYEATDMRAPGWSFMQPITTSHISGHYFEKPGKHPHIHMDVYSCDTVQWQKIVEIVHSHLSLTDWKASFIVRGWVEKPRSYLELTGHGPRARETQMLMTSPRAPRKAIPAKVIM